MHINDIESLLNKGRSFEAYNELEAALADDPCNVRLRQLLGLTLARLGLLERAKRVMEELAEEESDPETSGILGRIYKDYLKLTGDTHYLHRSVATYLKAFLEKKDGYNGINAATLTFLSGNRAEAVTLAEATISLVEQWPEGYWKEATLGEAYLLIGKINSSREHYVRAKELGRSDAGSIHSTVEQLRLLAGVIPDARIMADLFDESAIVIFAGHMIDHPSRSAVRFPESAADSAKMEIGKFLDNVKVKIGYSSLACGGDILFAESILERGQELNIILPFKIDDFLKTSVEFAGPLWTERFHAVLDKANTVKYTTEEGYLGDDVLFDLCARQTMGVGILRAGLFSVKPWLLTLWNGESGNTGGTGDSVKWFPWPDRHINVHPGNFTYKPVSRERAESQEPAAVTSPFRREMKYILFSDISGFSKLDEEKTPLFVLHYLHAISEKLQGFSPAPVILNTWGDAVFAVMDSPVALAEYACALQEAVVDTDWDSAGLPPMNVRIALHAGPVYLADDPLRGTLNAYGTHINRAARIEPVTAPGSIYASEPFAAALLLEKPDGFRFNYAGIIELPKKFGKQELYQIRKKRM